MLDNITENNWVSLVGRITTESKFNHELYGEGFYTFELDVLRLSKCYDKIPVIISERLIPIEMLEVGKCVKLHGQFRSYNSIGGNGRKLILMAFVRDIDIIDEDEYIHTKDPNEIYLNGFICKLPMYRKTPFGREICDLLVAVNRQYFKSDYIPCISWGRNAKFAQYLHQGDNIKLWGRVQSREYQKKHENGQVTNNRAYEISVSKMELITRGAASHEEDDGGIII